MQKNIKYVVGIVTALTFLSCSKDVSIYYLESSRGGDVYVSMPVLSKGIEIGSVTAVSVREGKAIIEISIKKDFILCDSTKFTISGFFTEKKTMEVTNLCLAKTKNDGDTLRIELDPDLKEDRFMMTKEYIDSIKSTYSGEEDSISVIIEK